MCKDGALVEQIQLWKERKKEKDNFYYYYYYRKVSVAISSLSLIRLDKFPILTEILSPELFFFIVHI